MSRTGRCAHSECDRIAVRGRQSGCPPEHIARPWPRCSTPASTGRRSSWAVTSRRSSPGTIGRSAAAAHRAAAMTCLRSPHASRPLSPSGWRPRTPIRPRIRRRPSCSRLLVRRCRSSRWYSPMPDTGLVSGAPCYRRFWRGSARTYTGSAPGPANPRAPELGATDQPFDEAGSREEGFGFQSGESDARYVVGGRVGDVSGFPVGPEFDVEPVQGFDLPEPGQEDQHGAPGAGGGAGADLLATFEGIAEHSEVQGYSRHVQRSEEHT